MDEEEGSSKMEVEKRGGRPDSDSSENNCLDEMNVESEEKPSSLSSSSSASSDLIGIVSNKATTTTTTTTAAAVVARYKLMSPSRLPISRSCEQQQQQQQQPQQPQPCFTIPPGLSPTVLFDSPIVLLSNFKAEPSPTTGMLSMLPIRSDAVNLPKNSADKRTCDEENSADLKFQLNNSSCSGSNQSSLGHLAPTGLDHLYSKSVGQGERHLQNFPFSSSAATEKIKVSSSELTLSVPASVAPVYMVSSKANSPAEVVPYQLEQRQGSDNSVQVVHSDNTDHKGPNPVDLTEKSLEDGYNWRKYGQKLVKGSEYPRCYYKCTHPNCQVKKQLERSFDGQITEVIYKGNHDHPKPLPGRRSTLGATMPSHSEEQYDGFSSLAAADRNWKSSNDNDKSLDAHIHQPHHIEATSNPPSFHVSASEGDIGVGAQCNKICDDIDDEDDPEAKRRKTDDVGVDVSPMIKAAREPRVVVQTLSEVDILDDGYRWRKYGQKVVKGNPNPRSYYKCTNAGCPVRKHVERASHDPKAVITTYEGKHNHDVPTARTSSHDTAGTVVPHPTSNLNSHMSATMKSILRAEDVKVMHQSNEDGSVSLDLGVGISKTPENRSNEWQTPYAEQARIHNEILGSSYNKLVHPTSASAYHTSLSSQEIINHQVPRNTIGENLGFKSTPLNHSIGSAYEQNVGRVIMGP